MHDSTFFMLQASQSSQAPSIQWVGSPTASAPPTWPPLPPTWFWPPLGPGYWHPPLQSYQGQLGGPPLPQMGQGYWPTSPPWGSPPVGQVPPPFGSPLLRTSPLWSTTSTPPTVCLLDYFTFLTRAFTCRSRQLRITTRRRARIRLCRCPLQPDGRIWWQRRGTVVVLCFHLP
jgi:hypothetical protein